MNPGHTKHCTAFEGFHRIESGDLVHVALKAKEVIDGGAQSPVLVFDDSTSEQVEVDFRGTAEDVRQRLVPAAAETATVADPPSDDRPSPRGPGRPKLGVVAREVTLLPRHWEWLNRQPGGASVALRKLVEEARRVNAHRDRVRASQDAAHRFMSVLAGNLPGFEESTRALFAGNASEFERCIASWPADVRDHARRLASVALGDPETQPDDGPA